MEYITSEYAESIEPMLNKLQDQINFADYLSAREIGSLVWHSRKKDIYVYINELKGLHNNQI